VTQRQIGKRRWIRPRPKGRNDERGLSAKRHGHFRGKHSARRGGHRKPLLRASTTSGSAATRSNQGGRACSRKHGFRSDAERNLILSPGKPPALPLTPAAVLRDRRPGPLARPGLCNHAGKGPAVRYGTALSSFNPRFNHRCRAKPSRSTPASPLCAAYIWPSLANLPKPVYRRATKHRFQVDRDFIIPGLRATSSRLIGPRRPRRRPVPVRRRLHRSTWWTPSWAILAGADQRRGRGDDGNPGSEIAQGKASWACSFPGTT